MHGFACFSTGVVQGLENARICNCIRISNPSITNHPTTKAEGSRLRQALQEGAALWGKVVQVSNYLGALGIFDSKQLPGSLATAPSKLLTSIRTSLLWRPKAPTTPRGSWRFWKTWRNSMLPGADQLPWPVLIFVPKQLCAEKSSVHFCQSLQDFSSIAAGKPLNICNASTWKIACCHATLTSSLFHKKCITLKKLHAVMQSLAFSQFSLLPQRPPQMHPLENTACRHANTHIFSSSPNIPHITGFHNPNPLTTRSLDLKKNSFFQWCWYRIFSCMVWCLHQTPL